MKGFVLTFFLFGFALPGFAQNTLLWEISGNGLQSPSYLYGTMHVLCKDNLPDQDSVCQSMTRCRRLVIEMDDSKVGPLRQLRLVRMRGDSSLGDLFNEEELKEVEQFFADSLKLRLSLLMRMKPALLSSLILLHALPCDKQNITGVEKELKPLAEELGLKVDELETFRYQAALFDSIPYALQAKDLLEGIRNYARLRNEFQELVRLYSHQALDTIAMLTHSDTLLSYDLEGKLLSNRNRNWVEKMPAMMERHPCFFAVGAAHLPGEQGVIHLLRSKGYVIRPVFSVNP